MYIHFWCMHIYIFLTVRICSSAPHIQIVCVVSVYIRYIFMCVHICMYTYIYMYTYTYICICIYIYFWAHHTSKFCVWYLCTYECVMSLIHMNVWCLWRYEYVMSHLYMNVWCLCTYACVMSHLYMNVCCLCTCRYVMSHMHINENRICTSHVRYECVMSHMNASSRILICHLT